MIDKDLRHLFVFFSHESVSRFGHSFDCSCCAADCRNQWRQIGRLKNEKRKSIFVLFSSDNLFFLTSRKHQLRFSWDNSSFELFDFTFELIFVVVDRVERTAVLRIARKIWKSKKNEISFSRTKFSFRWTNFHFDLWEESFWSRPIRISVRRVDVSGPKVWPVDFRCSIAVRPKKSCFFYFWDKFVRCAKSRRLCCSKIHSRSNWRVPKLKNRCCSLSAASNRRENRASRSAEKLNSSELKSFGARKFVEKSLDENFCSTWEIVALRSASSVKAFENGEFAFERAVNSERKRDSTSSIDRNASAKQFEINVCFSRRSTLKKINRRFVSADNSLRSEKMTTESIKFPEFSLIVPFRLWNVRRSISVRFWSSPNFCSAGTATTNDLWKLAILVNDNENWWSIRCRSSSNISISLLFLRERSTKTAEIFYRTPKIELSSIEIDFCRSFVSFELVWSLNSFRPARRSKFLSTSNGDSADHRSKFLHSFDSLNFRSTNNRRNVPNDFSASFKQKEKQFSSICFFFV